jgi:hypothetical protein
MPERAFVYQDVPTLKRTAAALEKALQTGQITDLQLSGIRTSMGQMGQSGVKQAYLQCRYEIFAHGAGLHGFDVNDECAALEPKNPYAERVMRVEQVAR